MRRISYYVTADAEAAMDAAVAHVTAALGDDVPKHVALSALIVAGAGQAAAVAAQLAQRRADELARRVEVLRSATTRP